MVTVTRTTENTRMNDNLTQADKDLLHYVMDTVRDAMVVAFATGASQHMGEEQKVSLMDTAERLAAVAITGRVMSLRPVQPVAPQRPVGFSNN